MSKHLIDTYFKTQSAAIGTMESDVTRRGYEIVYPERIWAEHVNYGATVKYSFPLKWVRTGNIVKRQVHIAMFRMVSGSYELTHYIN